MADNLGLSPGQPKDAEFPGEFRPAPTKECDSTYNPGHLQTNNSPQQT